jgi:hypothetical protein
MIAAEVARGRGPDGQDSVQPGDRQHAAGQPPRLVQDEQAVDGAQLVINAVKDRQPGDAQKLQLGQIEHDFRVAIPAQLIEYLLEMRGAGQIELSVQTHPTARGIRADQYSEAFSTRTVNQITP